MSYCRLIPCLFFALLGMVQAEPLPANAWTIQPFSLPALDGTRHSLADWRGKVILLNFWASWCSSCQYEIRDLVAWQERYGDRGLQVVGIGMDIQQKLSNVKRSLEINYPVLVADPELQRDLITRWGNRDGTIPYTVVIDRNGRIVLNHRGLLDRDTFEEYVMPLIRQAANSADVRLVCK
ncbi:MAG: TlpA disulfide reductase family protein [Proteobacteria bacterium]|nr:TlpA disulfide reductase family protein [Pseudomonadota bacterium]